VTDRKSIGGTNATLMTIAGMKTRSIAPFGLQPEAVKTLIGHQTYVKSNAATTFILVRALPV